jgi:stringent starvation protein A
MTAGIPKRSVITLYVCVDDVHSHRVRLVLAEKGVHAHIIELARTDELPETLLQLNPYGTLPSMVDRDLVLYEPNIICEYLDERFPHPPLLPVYPVARAKSRQMIYRINRDWYPLLDTIEKNIECNPKQTQLTCKRLYDSLLALSPLFAGKPYFLSEELTLVDCCLAPLLWRLSELGMKIPDHAQEIKNYAQRIFKRPTFNVSLGIETEWLV